MGVSIIPDRDSSGGVIQVPSAFSSKTIADKSLFKRVHGVKYECGVGVNTFIFAVPYAQVKINTVEVIGCESLDTCSFEILDSSSGTYTGNPNHKLNQFGYGVVMSKDYYEQKSEYDADLFLGMQIKVTYNSLSAKDIGINFVLNEVK